MQIRRQRRLRVFLVIAALTMVAISSGAHKWALKTNLPYWATLTPNLDAELRVSDKWSVEISVGYNAWTLSNNRKLKHIADPDLLSQFTIAGLYKTGCSLLYPTENAGDEGLTTVNTTETYNETIKTGAGNLWMDRKSVYIIQKRDRTTSNFSLLLNDGAEASELEGGPRAKLTITRTGTLSAIPGGYYTQWFLGTIGFPETTGSGTE